MRNGRFVDRERLEPMLFALNDKPWMRWFWQRQLAELKLNCSFPNRHNTQVNDVRVLDHSARRAPNSHIARDVPQENMGIEQQLHCSKSRSISSGSGSSKSSGTTKAPAARPNGRGFRTASIGRISATGRSRSVKTRVSPS